MFALLGDKPTQNAFVESFNGRFRGECLNDTLFSTFTERTKVEMPFAHLKRILRLDRLRLRGPNGAKDELHRAAAAQNLRKHAKILPNGPQIRAA